jgi:chemotaxis-related protein WspB
MLLLVFRVAGETYAVEARRVVEVVPRVELRGLPHAPEALAGLFVYRGEMVPVFDLGVLLDDGPSRPLLSTRIILVDARPPSGVPAATRVGLIAEHVSEVCRVGDDRATSLPASFDPNPYIGPIISTPSGLIPLVAVDRFAAGPLRVDVIGSGPATEPVP